MAAKTKNILKFSAPAKWWGSGWREALVTGSGIVGCSVLGGAAEDTLMLTHSDLWWQGKVGTMPDVSDNLAKTRKLLDEGKYKEAQSALPDALINKSYHPRISYPLPICDFKIHQKNDRPPKEYVRSVNLDSGEITVGFKDGATRYQRSVFVARTDDLVVMELTKTGSKMIDADFSFEMHDKFNNRTPTAISNLPEGVSTKADGKFLCFSARSDNGSEYGAVAYISYFGGTPANAGDSVTIRGAEKVFIVIRTFINVKNHENKWKEIRDELKGFKQTYDKLLKEQTSAMIKQTGKAYLSLDDSDVYADKLLADAASNGELSAALTEKLWAYGRYLFVSATTPSSPPIAPYGIWCGDYNGVNSHLNADGSLQLMYEHALAGNLTEYFESLLGHYETVLDDLKKNAIRLYNVRGIMIPSVTARGTGLLGRADPAVIYFTGAAGWLCKLFYEAYLCGGDAKFLKSRVLPFLKETAQFYTEFFTEQSEGLFESCPGYSPLSEPSIGGGETLKIAKNPLIDFAIARELFQNLIEISEETGTNKADIPKWKDFLNHIPAYKLNSDGTVKEYDDAKVVEINKNASTAMFYPVFPGTAVNDTSGEVFKQFEKTAQKRFAFGLHQSSVTLSRFANLFIRLNQPKQAEDIIAAMLSGTAMSNLIFSASDWSGMGIAGNDIWATYTVEPNLMLTNAIQEMFVRSDKENIWLLPACTLNKGELGGFLTRCGVEITELEWDKKGISIKLKAKKATKINLRLRDAVGKYKGSGKVEDDKKTISGIELPGGKFITLDIKF